MKSVASGIVVYETLEAILQLLLPNRFLRIKLNAGGTFMRLSSTWDTFLQTIKIYIKYKLEIQICH